MSKLFSKDNRSAGVKGKARALSAGVKDWYCSHDNAFLIWTFLIPFAIMLMIYIAMSVFPFGRGTVLVLDLNGQYIYFFEALRDWVYGEGSLLYSFSRALGGEFMGIYAYYLASPLSYIVALFPKSMITEAVFLMLLIKCGLSGLTFGYCLRKTTDSGRAGTVIFSVLYALSGYAIVMQHNTMWTDCMILLPLIAVGMRALIRDGKYKLFTLALALSILSNFYIGYMSCIFVFLYFFCLYFSMSPEERNPSGKKLYFVRSLAKVGIFSAIAVGMAMIIILPAYYSLSFGKTEFSDPTYNFNTKFDLLDMLTKLFFGSYDTVRPEGLPFIYCGTLTLILIPFFFSSEKIPLRKKATSAILILLLVLGFNINTLNLIWHGFQNPNWLNYRESYMMIFIMLLMAAQAFTHIRSVNPRSFLLVGAGLIALLVMIQYFEYDYLDDMYTILAGIGIIIVYVFALIAMKMNKNAPTEFAASLLAIAVCLEAFGGGLLNIAELSDDVGFSSRASYAGFIDRWQGEIDYVKGQDDSFYRMEKTVTRKVNDPFALGYRGLSGSTSTLNADTIAFLSNMGISSKSHWTQYVRSGNPATNSLLSLKYLVAEADEDISELYELYHTDGDVSVYYNPYALSLAFGSSQNIKLLTFEEYEFDDENNAIEDGRAHVVTTCPFTKINAMYSAILGYDTEIFTSVRYSGLTCDNVYQAMLSGHRKYTVSSSGADGTITYTLTAPKDGEIYFYMPSTYTREVALTLNGESFGTYFTNATHGIIPLGSFDKDDYITLTLTLKKDEVYIGTGVNYFYYFNEDVFKSAISAISAYSYNIEEYSETYFKGKITLDDSHSTVLTTIAYDKGWKVTVDGVEVETYETVDALLAFDAGAGEHTIEMRYMPSAFTAGATVTALSCVVFAAIIGGEFTIRYLKKKKSHTDLSSKGAETK